MASDIKIDQEPVLSVQKRLELVQRLQAGAPISRIAGEFDIRPSTARRIRRNTVTACQPADHRDIAQIRDYTRKSSNENVDSQLYSWLTEQNAIGTSVTDSSLWEKAVQLQKELGGPMSRGWLANFKERHRVKLSESAGNSNLNAEVFVKEEVMLDETAEAGGSWTNEVDPEGYMSNFVERLQQEGVSIKDVYYMKDITLMWKAFPETLLQQCKSKKDRIERYKRDRVTVAVCCNVTGCRKLESLFIYNNEKPTALKHCRDRLPVLFKSQSDARMDRSIFLSWFEEHFKPTAKMLQFPDSDGKVVLILDDQQRRNLELTADFGQTGDVQVSFFPACASHFLQPLEQEIAEKTKRSYRLKMLGRVPNCPGGIQKFYFDYDLKDCIDLFAEAWAELDGENVQATWARVVDKTTEDYQIKEEPGDPLQPNLRDIISLISGEQDAEETLDEFLSQCEETERKFMRQNWVEDNEEEDERDKDEDEFDGEVEVPDDQVMKKAFNTLLRWSKHQPQYIQLQVEYLKNYYESTISNK